MSKGVTFAIDDVKLAEQPLAEVPFEAGCRSLLKQAPFVTPLPETFVVQDIFYHPLIAATFLAFSQHRPLILSPDMIWTAIAQGAAQHINNHAEELRPLLVMHSGKRQIEIEREEWEYDSPEWWQTNIHLLREKMTASVQTQAREALLCEFSTTTDIERTVGEIVMLDAFKCYFDYTIKCVCGIPWITLEGTVADWQKLRQKIEGLTFLNMDWWLKRLRPICDEFIAFAEGHLNRKHWQNICKLTEAYDQTEINGWMVQLIPYTKNGATGDFDQLNPIFNDGGITSNLLPTGVSEVPFKLNYLGLCEIDLKLTGGFLGLTQDNETLALRPLLAWGVTDNGQLSELLSIIRCKHMPNPPNPTSKLPEYEMNLQSLQAFYNEMDGASLFPHQSSPAFVILPAKDVAPPFSTDEIAEIFSDAPFTIKEWNQLLTICRNQDGSVFVFSTSGKEYNGKTIVPFYHLRDTGSLPKLRLVTTSFEDFLAKLLNSDGELDKVLAESETEILDRA